MFIRKISLKFSQIIDEYILNYLFFKLDNVNIGCFLTAKKHYVIVGMFWPKWMCIFYYLASIDLLTM